MVMTKNQNRMNELIELLNKYSVAYYTKDNPLVSDKKYDKLYKELVDLEEQMGVQFPNSPTLRVGDIILDKFKKVKHKNKLWSLDKCQSFEELIAWDRKITQFCKEHGLPQPKYVVTKKFDGITVKCTYNSGNLNQGSTRGTGVEGEDITAQVNTIINLPKTLQGDFPESISAHGEGLMTKKAFQEYNKTAKSPLKNLRNGVAGALRNLDTKETAKRKPIIMFYNINDITKGKTAPKFINYHSQLDYLKYLGLPTAEYTLCSSMKKVLMEINNIESERNDLPYDIDGAVIAIDDIETRKKLGYTIKFPKFSMSYKYEAQEDTTKLIDVEWNVSRTGKIVPTAILEPVELNGVTVKRGTLNNLSDMERKGLKLNCEVFIRRSNDVIPEITGVVEDSLDNSDVQEIEIPEMCPCCGQPTEIRCSEEGNKQLYCTNLNCRDRLLQGLVHFCSRDSMNIRGLSEKTLEKFIDLGFLTSIVDIYKLSEYKQEISTLKGFGVKSYNNIIDSIDASRTCNLENFISALGIPLVGKSTAKDLVSYLDEETSLEKLDVLRSIQKEELLDLEDCGEATAQSLCGFFEDDENQQLLEQLIEQVTFIEPTEDNTVKDGVLQGKSYYLTGSFAYGKKAQLKDLVESNGGVFAENFNKQIDGLVIGSLRGSTKDKKAIEWGIPVLMEDEFLKLL